MDINIVKMTGSELKKIYKSSGLNGDEFADCLGISRGGLYLLFKDKIVSEAVELKIIQNPELNRIRQLSSPNVKSELSEMPELSKPGRDMVSLLFDSLQAMKEMMAKSDKQSDLLQKTFDKISSDSNHIKAEAETYRKILMDGYNAGLLKWNIPGA